MERDILQARKGKGIAAEIIPLFLVIVLLAAFGLLIFSQLDHFMWDDDESVLICTARAVQQGHKLYDTVWFGYTPGFIYLLAGAFELLGFDIAVARLVVGILALAALAAVAALARTVGGHWAGAAAVALLAPIPHFVVMSSAAMIEVPAMALVTASTLAVVAYLRREARGWLALSGVLMSGALLLKPTVLAGALLPAVAVFLVERAWSRRWICLALLGLCGLSLLLPGVLASNPGGFHRQVLHTYLQGKSAVVVDYGHNLENLAEYLLADKYGLTHIALVGLGLYGLWALWRRDRRVALLLGLWLLSVLAVLLTHAPLYRHHLVQTLFPLAVLAGVGLAALGHEAVHHTRPGWRYVALASALCLVLLEGGRAAWIDLFRLREIESDHLDKALQAVAFLQQHTAPGDYIITDAHILALRAGRPVPPELTDTSRRRIRTGQLNAQRVTEIAQRYRPAAIVFWEEKLEPTDKSEASGAPDYLDRSFATWVTEHYTLAAQYSERHRIYVRREPPVSSP
ncbi:MAG: glycosyltransferase family 39 protein [Chloroflexi bacterium]|nr:glycosyltransferase family 39 protein [Chloroflexota bacterium]